MNQVSSLLLPELYVRLAETREEVRLYLVNDSIRMRRARTQELVLP